MSERMEKGDRYSGIPWVYVTPEEARGHPKGRLTPTLWLIGLYFIAAALLKIYQFVGDGAGVVLAVAFSLWPLLAGIGILMRAPWAMILAAVSAGLSAFALVRSMGPVLATGGVTAAEADLQNILLLAETLIQVGILFYLIDGDRPNFIYRHRYRKYSVLKEGE